MLEAAISSISIEKSLKVFIIVVVLKVKHYFFGFRLQNYAKNDVAPNFSANKNKPK